MSSTNGLTCLIAAGDYVNADAFILFAGVRFRLLENLLSIIELLNVLLGCILELMGVYQQHYTWDMVHCGEVTSLGYLLCMLMENSVVDISC